MDSFFRIKILWTALGLKAYEIQHRISTGAEMEI